MKRTHLENVKFWQQHIESAKSFPGSIHAYCRAQKIDSSSFYQWRKKLSIQQGSRCTKPEFVPVVVSRREDDASAMSMSSPEARWVAEFVAHLVRGLQ